MSGADRSEVRDASAGGYGAGRGKWSVLALGAVSVFLLVLVLREVDLSDLLASMSRFSLPAIMAASGLLLLNILLTSARLAVILADFGHRIGFPAASRINVLSQAAGSFLHFFGLALSRGYLLFRQGVPPATTLGVTVYEKIVVLGVSFAIFLMGGYSLAEVLLGDIPAATGAMMMKTGAAIVGAIALCLAFAYREPARRALAFLAGRRALARMARVVIVSVAAQLCVLGAYVVLQIDLAGEIGIGRLVAASAVVMFVASLPISFGGWGVREGASAILLGTVGMATTDAVAVAIVIGGLALAVLATAYLALRLAGLVGSGPGPDGAAPDVPGPRLDVGHVLALALPLVVATLIFFQIHVPFAGGVVNVNLADPLVVVGGIAFLAYWGIEARRWPEWRLRGLVPLVVIASVLLALSWVWGWLQFGSSGWATGKLVGWVVLLAYAATGALVVHRGGREGGHALMATLLFTATAVAAVDIALLVPARVGLFDTGLVSLYQLEGFAQNRNAFAFQIMVAVACALALLSTPDTAGRFRRPMIVALGFCLAALVMTGSRSATPALPAAVAVAALAAALPLRPLQRPVALAFVIGAAIILSPFVLSGGLMLVDWAQSLMASAGPDTPGDAATASRQAPRFADFYVSAAGSDAERWPSIRAAFDMWLEAPLLGAGLGAFVEYWHRMHGEALVIHSTPLWLLAEFGIVGALGFAALFGAIAVAAFRGARAGEPAMRMLVVVLLAFGAMALVHEMLYQRIFWLVLGAALASPTAAPGTTPVHEARPEPAMADTGER